MSSSKRGPKKRLLRPVDGSIRSIPRLIDFGDVLSLRVRFFVFNVFDGELPYGERDHLRGKWSRSDNRVAVLFDGEFSLQR